MITTYKRTRCQRSERDIDARIKESIITNVNGEKMYPTNIINYDYIIAKMASLRIPERAALHK